MAWEKYKMIKHLEETVPTNKLGMRPLDWLTAMGLNDYSDIEEFEDVTEWIDELDSTQLNNLLNYINVHPQHDIVELQHTINTVVYKSTKLSGVPSHNKKPHYGSVYHNEELLAACDYANELLHEELRKAGVDDNDEN